MSSHTQLCCSSCWLFSFFYSGLCNGLRLPPAARCDCDRRSSLPRSSSGLKLLLLLQMLQPENQYGQSMKLCIWIVRKRGPCMKTSLFVSKCSGEETPPPFAEAALHYCIYSLSDYDCSPHNIPIQGVLCREMEVKLSSNASVGPFLLEQTASVTARHFSTVMQGINQGQGTPRNQFVC